MLWKIYTSDFESRFAICFADSYCPYIALPPGTKISIAGMDARLDAAESEIDQEQVAEHTPQTSAHRLLTIVYSMSPGEIQSTRIRLGDCLCAALFRRHSLCTPIVLKSKSIIFVTDCGTGLVRRCLLQCRGQATGQILALYFFTLTETPILKTYAGVNALCNQVI